MTIQHIFAPTPPFLLSPKYLLNFTIPCLIVGGGKGSNKMHKGENYQDFVRLRAEGAGVSLGHSHIVIK